MTASIFADHGKIVVANRSLGTKFVINNSTMLKIEDVELPLGNYTPELMYVVNTRFKKSHLGWRSSK